MFCGLIIPRLILLVRPWTGSQTAESGFWPSSVYSGTVMTGDNPVIEFSSYYRHAVKVYEGDFHGLTWNVGPFITSDWSDSCYINCCFGISFAHYRHYLAAKAVNQKLECIISSLFNWFQLITLSRPFSSLVFSHELWSLASITKIELFIY